MAGPGQVFGKGLGLIAFEQRGKPLQMLKIQRTFGSDGQANAVQRQR
jgi:hypothetical protein